MKKTGEPTRAELEILAVLWERGAATVREVHTHLSARKPAAYTTVLKTMQIMTEKGLVEPDKSSRAHVYRAVVQQKETGRTMLGELLRKAFGGSALKLVQQVLEAETTTPEEMREIRRMIERAEKSGGQKRDAEKPVTGKEKRK